MTFVRSTTVCVTAMLVSCALLLAGCGRPAPETVTIDPASTALTVGQTQQFTATILDRRGRPIEDLRVAWSVEGEGAHIDTNGHLVAVKAGTATVTAIVEGHEESRATASVTISPEPVASLDTSLRPTTVVAGQQAQLTLTAKNAVGNGIADIDVQIQATSEGTDLDKTSALTDATGQAVFTISTGPKVQQHQVTIQAGAKQATVAFQTESGPPATVRITASPTEIVAGEEGRIQVTVRDQADNPVPGATVQFRANTEGTTVAPTQAATDDRGQATTAVRAKPTAGANQVQVSVPGAQDAPVATFQSLSGPPARIALQADRTTTVAGDEVPLTISIQDAHGNRVAGAEIRLTASPADAELADTTLISNDSGVASTRLRLSPTPGTQTVEAAVDGAPAARLSITAQQPTELQITPQTATVEMQGSQPFRAVALDADGNSVEVQPDWQASGDSGTIDAEGVFTAKALGEAAILATYGNLKSGAQLTVVPGEVAIIEVTPAEATLTAGVNLQFQADVFNAHRYPLDVKPIWEVSNEVGTIDAVGLFTAVKSGDGTIIATVGAQTGQAQVTVEPGPLTQVSVEPQTVRLEAGQEIQLQAKGYDATGNDVPIEPVWRLAADLGTLSADGVFRAVHAGTGEIKVEAGPLPIVVAIPVEVVPAELDKIDVTPATLTMRAGEQHTFTATGYDAFGNVVAITPVWQLGTDDVGQIDENGSFYARKTGTVQVYATADDIRGEASVTVRPNQLAKLTIQPSGPLTLRAGSTVSFTLNGYDAFDNTVALQPTWRQTPELGTISAEGFFRAEQVGSGELIAQQDDLRVAVPIAVTAGKLARIAMTPEKATLQAGNVLNWQAKGFDAYGNEIDIEPTWRVTQELGDITETGEFTATQAQTGEVIATVEGVSSHAEVTVQPGNVTWISVTPTQLHLTAGDTAELIVVGYDAFGNPTPVEPVWHVPNDMGSVSTDNVLTAQKAGRGRIVVAVDDLAEVIDFSVVPGKPATLVIEPADAQVESGTEQQYTAQALDRGGNVVPADVTWSVQGEGGQITADGLFTATQAGTSYIEAATGDVTGDTAVEVVPGAAVSLQVSVEKSSLTAGEKLPLQASAVDAAGNEITEPPTWRVEGDIGTISEDGVFTAKRAGTGTIIATQDDISQGIEIEVSPGALATVVVSPQDVSLQAGETRQFSATGYDAYHNTLPVDVTWSVHGGIGNIDAQGLLQATTKGAGAVIATTDGVSGLSNVTVEPGKVARLLIPPSHTVVAGEAIELNVEALDAYGNETSAGDLEWDLTPALGQLDRGRFQGTKAGTTTLTVRQGALEARTSIEVQAGKAVRLHILPEDVKLASGNQVQLRAVGIDAYDNARDVSPTWTLSGDIGTLNQDGVFTARKQGSGHVTAQWQTLSASKEVLVTPGTVQRLRLDPAQAQVASTTSQAFTVAGFDAAGNEVSVDVTWALSEDIGTLTQTGQFTGIRVGKGTIVAYTPTVLATADVTVLPGPVALIFVTPQPFSAAAGESVVFKAHGVDANRNQLPVLQPQWQVVGDIGTIDAETGHFTATHIGNGKVEAKIGDQQGSADVAIHPGSPDGVQSRLVASRLDLPADGRATADIIVYVRDRYGNPIPEAQVTLISSREDLIGQPEPTNHQGMALGHIRSTVPGESALIAVVDSVRISNPITLTFKGPKGAG